MICIAFSFLRQIFTRLCLHGVYAQLALRALHKSTYLIPPGTGSPFGSSFKPLSAVVCVLTERQAITETISMSLFHANPFMCSVIGHMTSWHFSGKKTTTSEPEILNRK